MIFDDVFKDLENAIVMRQEINCFKQSINGRTRWIIEIDDPQSEANFETRLKEFLRRIGGKKLE